MKMRIWPAPSGKARILTRKIGYFPDKFSGISCNFLGGLGLNPGSWDIQLYTSFEILKIDQDLKKWQPKKYKSPIFIVVNCRKDPVKLRKNHLYHYGSHLLYFQWNSKISKVGDRWISQLKGFSNNPPGNTPKVPENLSGKLPILSVKMRAFPAGLPAGAGYIRIFISLSYPQFLNFWISLSFKRMRHYKAGGIFRPPPRS